MSGLEIADANRGTRMTAEDRERYTGIIQHPMARRWLLEKLVAARENAAMSFDEQEAALYTKEAERVTAQLRDGGYEVSGEAR